MGLNFVNEEMSKIIGDVITTSDKIKSVDHLEKYYLRMQFYNNSLNEYFIDSFKFKEITLMAVQCRGNVYKQNLLNLIRDVFERDVSFSEFHMNIRSYRLAKFRRTSEEELRSDLIEMLLFLNCLDKEQLKLY